MNTLDDIWDALFEREISDSERRVMENIARHTHGEESTFISSAVTVHCLYSALILDPDNPVRLVARVGNALKNLETRTSQMIGLLGEAVAVTSSLKYDAQEIRQAFATAEAFARWQRNNQVTVFRSDKVSERSEYSVSLDILGIVVATCVASSIFGGLIAFAIGLMVWSGF